MNILSESTLDRIAQAMSAGLTVCEANEVLTETLLPETFVCWQNRGQSYTGVVQDIHVHNSVLDIEIKKDNSRATVFIPPSLIDWASMRAKAREEAASCLLNTSIEDASSSARSYSLEVLVEAHRSAMERGQKSKARMLQTEINKRKKALLAQPGKVN